MLFFGMTEAISPQASEYMLKGIFLEKFTRFIEWPKSSGVEDSTKPFIISVIGKDPFKSLLDQLYSSQKIRNKKVELRYVSDISDIDDCNILFIARSEKYRIAEIIGQTRQKPILTVGDSESLTGSGVIINLRLTGNKIRFEINEDAAREANLYMSHLLLKEAIIVDSGGRHE
jgi:hypothetical protein